MIYFAISMDERIEKVLSGALERGFIEESDRVFFYNRLTDALKTGEASADLASRLWGVVTPPPSAIIKKFWGEYKKSATAATDWLYSLAVATEYVKAAAISKNLHWTHPCEYGALDITVNLSKPEKDPKAIALAATKKAAEYPKCAICRENEGFSGSTTQAVRDNLRLIPITLGGEQYFFQYSPYAYYREHCIILSAKHTPMKIDERTYWRLFDFLDIFPHYIIGSNADLPIVGGSILSHDHYQGGRYDFALSKAKEEQEFTLPAFSKTKLCTVKWPMSTIRLSSPDKNELIKAATCITKAWRQYSDESVGILSFSEENGGSKKIAHSTVTPIARKRGEVYEVDLILRNNRTSAEHPDGIFHPHAEYHHVKKENIGLIEAAGLAILPGRLAKEAETEAQKKYLGETFLHILDNCAVFKRNDEGRAAFRRFIESIGGRVSNS